MKILIEESADKIGEVMSTHNSIETDAWIAGLKAEISRLNDALTLTSEGNRRLQEQLFNAEQQVSRAEKDRDRWLDEFNREQKQHTLTKGERDRFRAEADTKAAVWASAEKHLAECRSDIKALCTDPALHFCHRFAMVL